MPWSNRVVGDGPFGEAAAGVDSGALGMPRSSGVGSVCVISDAVSSAWRRLAPGEPDPDASHWLGSLPSAWNIAYPSSALRMTRRPRVSSAEAPRTLVHQDRFMKKSSVTSWSSRTM